VHIDDKVEALFMRGRSSEKVNTSKINFRSKFRGCKANKICHFCKRQGYLIVDCYKSKNKEIEENNKQPQQTVETDFVQSNSIGDVLLATTFERRNSTE